jgi:ADP-heptose:LPS heptosyltransferase
MSLLFNIKETYKKYSKRVAINLMQLRWGRLNKAPLPPDQIESVIILAQERFGDIIVTTPLFRNLRKMFPKMEITVLGVTEIINILKPDRNLNLVCNIKRADQQLKQQIFSRTYDVLYNTKDHPSFTFIKLSGKIKARHKVGIYHERHTGFFHHMFDLDDTLPTVEKNLALMNYLGAPVSEADVRPYLPAGPVSSEIKEFIQTVSGKKLTGINLSASNRNKEWGPERWREFLNHIDAHVIILSTKEHLDNKRALEQEFSQVIPSPLTPSIFDVGYMVQHMQVLVTPDTSLVHVASCYDTPIVALYRLERDLQKFKPMSKLNRVHVTPSGELDDIQPSDVVRSYQYILKELKA